MPAQVYFKHVFGHLTKMIGECDFYDGEQGMLRLPRRLRSVA